MRTSVLWKTCAHEVAHKYVADLLGWRTDAIRLTRFGSKHEVGRPPRNAKWSRGGAKQTYVEKAIILQAGLAASTMLEFWPVGTRADSAATRVALRHGTGMGLEEAYQTARRHVAVHWNTIAAHADTVFDYHAADLHDHYERTMF
jgi:hypothetical protein